MYYLQNFGLKLHMYVHEEGLNLQHSRNNLRGWLDNHCPTMRLKVLYSSSVFVLIRLVTVDEIMIIYGFTAMGG